MTSDPQLPHLLEREKQFADLLFSGDLAPGAKVTERDLARNLKISRIPVREMMAKMVSRGVLVKDDKNRSVRLRKYSADEVVELFEMREALEVAAARLACRKATEADLLQMQIICDRMDQEIETADAPLWTELDRFFHETMIRASQNVRLIDSFGLLLRECHYVFYRHPSRWGSPVGGDPGPKEKPPKDKILTRSEQMRSIVDDHRKMLDCIRAKDPDAVQSLIRSRMQHLAQGVVHSIVSEELSKGKFSPG